MKFLTIFLIITACIKFSKGPQESIKPIYETPRMTGMNGANDN